MGALPDIFGEEIGGATLSPCERYRYHLWRQVSRDLGAAGRCVFVMLNPSTADETVNDRTVSKCMKYARAWGYEFLDVFNIFAWRSTDPSVLKSVDDPIGPENDTWISRIPNAASIIVAAWGKNGELHGRGEAVRQALAPSGKLHYLRLTGNPWHPLYLPDALTPTRWI